MNDKLDMWFIQNGKHFPQDSIFNLQDKLSKLPESSIRLLFGLDLKNPVVMLLLCIFLSPLGIDRFMIGHIGMGLFRIAFPFIIGITLIFEYATADAPIFTILLMIAWVIYAILEMAFCMKRTREYNLQLVMKTIGVTR